jgi:hypothetical protein
MHVKNGAITLSLRSKSILISGNFDRAYNPHSYRHEVNTVLALPYKVTLRTKTHTIVAGLVAFIREYNILKQELDTIQRKDEAIEEARFVTACALVADYDFVHAPWGDSDSDMLGPLRVKDIHVRELRVDAPNSIRVQLNNVSVDVVRALLDAIQKERQK